MGFHFKIPAVTIPFIWILFFFFSTHVHSAFNYKDALSKSIIFFEAQRSGKLGPGIRLPWRGDSAVEDGKLANVDLAGGYYDAGDNVKYGLPMAFTITTMAWSAISYKSELQKAGEWDNVLDAIRWGTDYFLKTASRRNRLYVQVGDPEQDHQCWINPENMETPRTVLKIDSNTPGTEIAAETSAAMAASSIVFRKIDRAYSRRLLNKAKLLFVFAKSHKGTYDGECPFYCSYSGYNDELLWAASWLYTATRRESYLRYIKDEAITATVSEFSWDLKYAGAQILLAGLFMKGEERLESYKKQADGFICKVIPGSPYQEVYISPGGMLHLRDGANTQYVTGTALLFSVYGDMLQEHKEKVSCGEKQFSGEEVIEFAKKQMDYLLGDNPQGRSYMVGFGKKSPTQPHHRGASVPVKSHGSPVTCAMTFVYWFRQNVPNPNELTGAIVGGPDRFDNFNDQRWASSMLEPCTYINSLAIGALAKLTSFSS